MDRPYRIEAVEARAVMPTQTVRVADPLDRYDALLLGAYGVLVNGSGAMPGAGTLIKGFNKLGLPFRVVTNDASRLPETAARRYRRLGLDIPAARILTSGSLLAPYFREHDLAGCRCTVLGPADSRAYVECAGGGVVPPGAALDALVIADESGVEPFLEIVNAVLSTLLQHLDRGEGVHLLLPNPDLIFPQGARGVGITAGAVAALIEAVLAERYPDRLELRFTRLGKPAPTTW